MNSFFLFNGKNSVLWLLAIQIFLTIESLITQGIELAHIISIFIAFIIVFLFFKQSNRELHIIKSMFKLANSIEKGKLEYRITHIDPKSELGPIAWNFNEALDQIEAYMREVNTCFQSAENKEFYRKAQVMGIKGDFSAGLEKVDVSLGMMEQNHFNTVRDELFSQLGQMKTENLLNSLHRTQDDLSRIANEMEQVEGITKHSSDISSASQASLGTVIDQLTQIITN